MTTRSESGPAGDTLIGMLTVTLTLVGWTVTPLIIKFFTEHIDAWTSNGWRYAFAALIWSPLLVWGGLRKSLPPGLFRAALVPALINSAAQVAFTTAHYKIDPGLLTFGLRAQMIFVAIGAALLFPTERRVIRTWPFLLGVGFVFVGTVGTMLMGAPVEGERSGYITGVTLAVLAGAGFAGYALAVRKYMSDIPSLLAFAAISLYTAIAMVAMMLLLGENFGANALDLSGKLFALLLLSAVIGIALGHVLYYIAIKRLGVAVSTGVLQLQPVCVSVLSYFAFSEILNLAQWLSGSLAIVGAMLMLWVQHRIKKDGASDHEYDTLPPDHVAAAAMCEDEAS